MSDRVAKQVLTVAVTMAMGAGTLAAQSRLTGTVRDTTGAPIAGVEISATGLQRTATTDRSGTFRLDGIPVGSTTITARRLGYAPQSTILRIGAGDNTLPDIILTVIPRELDTVSTREQQLWRERPLLREFAENQRLGMGQFITRADFEKNRGGFLSPMLDQRRGMIVVRGPKSATWIGNKYLPIVSGTDGDCTELEDYAGGPLSPAGANCNYCFPDVYLDYAKISTKGAATNIGRFNPDMLEGMEIYLGAAETPPRYASGLTSCGVIVLHTRAVDRQQRRIAAAQDGPTRSRVLVNVSGAAGHPGAWCDACGLGSTVEATAGYTFRDRWVVGGRYARWTGEANGSQSLSMRTVNLEWYPHPEPARLKWFLNAGVGKMDVSLRSQPDRENLETFTGKGLPMTSIGTGLDVAIFGRLVITPFASLARNFGGQTSRNHCTSQFRADGTVSTVCLDFPKLVQPTFTFTQLGTRFGWR